MNLTLFNENKISFNTYNDIIVSHIILMENIDIYYLQYSSINTNRLLQIEEEIKKIYPSVNMKSNIAYHEFVLSRWLYKNVIENLPIYKDESPYILKNNDGSIDLTKTNVLVSLSHKKGDCLLGITSKSKYLSIGVDIEAFIPKTYLKDKILTEKEMERFELYLSKEKIELLERIKSEEYSKESILLAVYFSTKESIYKTLYPEVQKYFYFKDVEIEDIDFNSNTIRSKIKLNLDSIPQTIESRFNFITNTNKVWSVSYL